MSGQDLPINFSSGIDTKTDPRQVKPQKFLSLENMVFQEGGALTKRNGFSQYTTGVTNPQSSAINLSIVPANVGVGRMVTQFNQELILCDGFNLYSYSVSDLTPSWVYKGRATLASLAQTNINKDINNNTQQDSAQSSALGWNLFAWVNDSTSAQPGLFCNLVDQITQQVLFTINVSTTGIKPRCVAFGGNLYVIYYDPTFSGLRAVTFNTIGVPGSPVTITSTISTSLPNYDLEVINNIAYLSYYTGSALVVTILNANLTTGASQTKTLDASAALSIFSDPSNNVWVSYAGSAGVGAVAFNAALSTNPLAPTLIDTTATGTSCFNVTGCFSSLDSNAYIFYDQNITPTQNQQIGSAISSTQAFFTQPAVGSNATVTLYTGETGGTSALAIYVGKVVLIPGGGFYTVVSVGAPSGGSVTITIKNKFASPPNTAAGQPVNGTVDPFRGAGTFVLYVYSTNSYSWINFTTINLSATIGTNSFYVNEANLASKAWAYLGVPTVGIVHGSQLEPTYFISNLYNYNLLAAGSFGAIGGLPANLCVKICASSAGGAPVQNILPQVNQQSATSYQIAFLQQDLIFTSTAVTTAGLTGGFISTPNVYSNSGVISDVIDFSQSNPSSAVMGNNLHIATGVLVMYDGRNVVEHNFHIFPEAVSAVIADGVSGSLSAGQYGYQFTYEWTDNQGQIHKSAPSPVVSITATAGSAVQFTVPFLSLTQKSGSLLVAYRTQVNGNVYFRLLPVGQTQPNLINGSASAVPSWTFIDGIPDTSLTANEQIYTTGEVENIGAPACFSLFSYKNRLILIPYDTPTQFWYSKQVNPGSPVEFSDLFVENVGTAYGPLTGGARLDDKIILGTQTNLVYVVGDGPAASGANNDFSDPIFITSDAGVVNQQSLVYSPIGLFFKSAKGLYLCGRDLSVSYFGSPVEAFNSQSVVGGQLIPNATQVRFMLSGGSTLMYDYFYGQWGQFTNPNGIGDCIYNNLHTYVNAAGQVFTETPGVYLDGAIPVTMSFLTANLNLAQISGYQRVYDFLLLYKLLSPCQIQVQAFYDYSSTPEQSAIFTLTNYPNERIHTKRQLCQAIQIGITELTSTAGAGFAMSGITYRIGIKKGMKPIPGASAAGLA